MKTIPFYISSSSDYFRGRSEWQPAGSVSQSTIRQYREDLRLRMFGFSSKDVKSWITKGVPIDQDQRQSVDVNTNDRRVTDEVTRSKLKPLRELLSNTNVPSTTLSGDMVNIAHYMYRHYKYMVLDKENVGSVGIIINDVLERGDGEGFAIVLEHFWMYLVQLLSRNKAPTCDITTPLVILRESGLGSTTPSFTNRGPGLIFECANYNQKSNLFDTLSLIHI